MGEALGGRALVQAGLGLRIEEPSRADAEPAHAATAPAPQVEEGHLADDLAARLAAAVHSDGSMSWFRVRAETYAVEWDGEFLLFSPLRGSVVRITKAGLAGILLDAAAPIGCCLRGSTPSDATPTDETAAMLAALDDSAGDVALAPAPETDFRPVRLTLSLTSACQLACTYCYIRGGERPRSMPWEVAAAAIRLTATNAAAAGEAELAIQFHGQGEPTANWPLLSRAVLFAGDEARSRGLVPAFSVMTNGILTRRKIAFLAAHRFSVGLSLDGVGAAHDAQRPMRDGRGSFDRIMRTCRLFAAADLPFGVRSTVSVRTVDEMSGFVRFLRDETACRSVEFEPVTNAGRACDAGVGELASGTGFLDRFADAFEHARAVGLEVGVTVGYAPCSTGPARATFCGAIGSNLSFCVATDGLVSSCYEVLDAADPRAAVFAYGRYEPASASFHFDPERLSRLRGLGVTKMARCAACFGRWTCAGGCLASVARGGIAAIEGSEPLPRCGLTRRTLRSALASLVTAMGEST